MVAEPVLKPQIYGEATVARRLTMTEPLDADLLKDLCLGKPPTFDGNDTDYKDFRFRSLTR